MHRHRLFWIGPVAALVALLMVVLLAFQVTRVTAGSRAEEHENEAAVYGNGQACGVERWSVKTGTDAGARSINLTYHFPTAISRLVALTAPSSLPSSSRVRLRASVSPGSMPYNAYPTLHAQTVPGAARTASVVYSIGRSPRSFDGSARTAGGNGLVRWTWHEEKRGSGGTVTVQCTYRGQSKTVQTSFSVTG